jgi:periplasmic divalent cation tolerance protein
MPELSPRAAGVRVALITAPDADVARRIALALVDERLAACVNVVPGIVSIYRWEGAVHEDAEALLVVKTSADRLAALAERLAVLHPYALPELVAFAPSGGSEAYLAWVREGCERAAPESDESEGTR